MGGTAFIPFKSQFDGERVRRSGSGCTISSPFRRDEFLTHYHQRSNVESTFSMIKRKFGDSLRSKTDTAMMNEVLCEVLCAQPMLRHLGMVRIGNRTGEWAPESGTKAVKSPDKPQEVLRFPAG